MSHFDSASASLNDSSTIETGSELAFPDATALAKAVRRGQVAVRDVVHAYLERLDRQHRTLNAAVEVFRKATTENPSGPLAGVPVSVKETIGIAGARITAGSYRAPSYEPDTDSPIVQRLKAAGAVILARGNVPECAMTHETDNLRYGATRNPLNPSFSPGGSSGGDAALVASGSVAAGVGSDLGGSVRYPAHCCGLVGFKPSSGDVPTARTWPPREPDGRAFFADSMLAFGPLTRSVRDARLLDRVLTGRVRPEGAALIQVMRPETFAATLRPPVEAAMTDVHAHLSAHEGMAHVTVPDAAQVYRDFLNVLLGDYGPFMTEALQEKTGAFSFARELVRHLRGRPSVHRYYLRLVLGMQVILPSKATANRARERLLAARQTIRTRLGDCGVLVLPTNGALAMRPGAASAYMARPGVRRLFTPTMYANALDLPALTIPLPVFRDASTGRMPSVQLVAAPGGESALFDLGRRLETWGRSGTLPS